MLNQKRFYAAMVLYTHRGTRFNRRTTGMRYSVSHTFNAEVSRTRYRQTSSTTNVVGDTQCLK